MSLVILMPLVSSMVYVVSVLMLKRSAQFGVGVWRTAFVTNLLMSVLFGFLLFLGGEIPGLHLLWQPALTGMLMIAGQVLTFVALEKGDVSVATPVMGVKTVLVAFFTSWVLSDSVPPVLWFSAILSALAVFLLNQGPRNEHHEVPYTIFISFLAATCYGLFDVLVQKWSPAWGVGRFLPIMFGFIALASLGLVFLFKAPLKSIPTDAWGWLLAGGFFMGIQGIILISAISIYGEATRINVIYSARGLWSVIAVWLVGHWFSNRENEMGATRFRYRIAGAICMCLAIAMALRV